MNKATFLKTAITSRLMQLYYHNCHHLTQGASFFSDHEFFGSAYGAMDGAYDRLAERYIGEFGNKAFETVTIAKVVMGEVTDYQVEDMCCCDMLETGLKLEQRLSAELTALDKVAPIGLRNLIGDLAEQSDIRQYKIKQRLAEHKDKDDK